MMKFIIFFLLNLNVIAATDLSLILTNNNIKQGEMVQAKIQVNSYSGSLSLNGATVADTIYFYKTSPLIRNSSTQTLEAEATIIFLKVPKGNSLSGSINNQEVNLRWSGLTIHPVEPPENFIFGEFQIPKKINLVFVFLSIVILGMITFFSFKKIKKIKESRIKRAKLKDLKNRLLNAIDYPEILLIWQNKHDYIATFPALEHDFLDWEKILFKYVFKPQVSEIEKQIIMSSYNDFKQKVGGKLSGV